MKKLVLPLALVISALVASGCSYSTSNSNTSPSTPVNSTQDPTGANTVRMKNFAFSPSTLTVKKGTTVVWINDDSAPHQIKSSTFNSQRLNQGQSFTFTFDTAGTFDYSCSIHPVMQGKIVVE